MLQLFLCLAALQKVSVFRSLYLCHALTIFLPYCSLVGGCLQPIMHMSCSDCFSGLLLSRMLVSPAHYACVILRLFLCLALLQEVSVSSSSYLSHAHALTVFCLAGVQRVSVSTSSCLFHALTVFPSCCFPESECLWLIMPVSCSHCFDTLPLSRK